MFDGTQNGHIKSRTYYAPASGNMASSGLVTTVTVIRGDAHQRGGGLMADLAEFGQFRQDGCGGDLTDAGNGIESFGPAFKGGIGGDDFGDGLVASRNLLFEALLELARLSATERVGVVRGAIGFGGEGVDQLQPPLRQLTQAGLDRGGSGGGFGLEGAAIGRKHGRIDGIGFSAQTFGFGEVSDPARFDDTDGYPGGVEDAHDRLFITAGGFANDMCPGMAAEAFEKLGMTLGVIGEGLRLAGEVELQNGLGNIEADVEDGMIVLTHTCKDTSCDSCRLPRSGNGSS